jgi:hypothetical protein
MAEPQVVLQHMAVVAAAEHTLLVLLDLEVLAAMEAAVLH